MLMILVPRNMVNIIQMQNMQNGNIQMQNLQNGNIQMQNMPNGNIQMQNLQGNGMNLQNGMFGSHLGVQSNSVNGSSGSLGKRDIPMSAPLSRSNSGFFYFQFQTELKQF